MTSETEKSTDLHAIPRFLWQIDNPFAWSHPASIHVDLGAGRFPRNPFGATKLLATDFHAGFNTPAGVEFVKADLTRDLPFEDNSIWSFSAFDVLEHIPRWERLEGEIRFPFIHLMSEIHRCLMPGGVFIAVTPAYPSEAAFQDPTHVNVITLSTVRYFSGNQPAGTDLGYGFRGDFNVITTCWLKGAGPFSSESLTQRLRERNGIEKLTIKIRLLRRQFLARLNFKPSHVIWVLEKNYDK